MKRHLRDALAVALRHFVLGIQRRHERLQGGVVTHLDLVRVRLHLRKEDCLLDRRNALPRELLHGLHFVGRERAAASVGGARDGDDSGDAIAERQRHANEGKLPRAFHVRPEELPVGAPRLRCDDCCVRRDAAAQEPLFHGPLVLSRLVGATVEG